MARDFVVSKDSAGKVWLACTTVFSRGEKATYQIPPTEYALKVEMDGSTMTGLSDVHLSGLRRVLEKCMDQLAIDASRELVEAHTSAAGVWKALGLDPDVKPIERGTKEKSRLVYLGGRYETTFSRLTAEKEKGAAVPTPERLMAQAEKMEEEQQKALLAELLKKFGAKGTKGK